MKSFNYNLHTAGRDRHDMPEFQTIRSSISRRRKELMPAILENVDNVQFENESTETWEGEHFILHQDNEWGLVVFATDEAIQTLQRCSSVFIDGTFKSCPCPYVQMVTVHSKLFGRMLPLVTALMTGKTIGLYRQLFQALKLAVRRRPQFHTYNLRYHLFLYVK